MSNENDMNNENEDVIPVTVETHPEPEALPVAEAPVEREPISEPYLPVDTKKPQQYRTLNVPNGPITDREIIERLQTESQRLNAEFKDQPDAPALKNFMATIEAFQEILATLYGESDYLGTMARTDANWVQRVTGDNGKKIAVSNPVFSPDKNSDRLEGMNAIRYLSSVTGVGSVTRIPLWHSGIVLTLDSFRERRLLDLHQTLVRQRMDIGTNTKGATYSGDDVFTTITIINFILEHAIDCNVKGLGVQGDMGDELKSLILVTDIPAILAGALQCIYPRGYPIFHQCVNTLLGSCDYQITAERTDDLGDYKPDRMLDFRKVLWTDMTRLTAQDRTHMSVVSPTHTVEEVRAYQRRVNDVPSFVDGVKLYQNDKVTIVAGFKVPTLDEYEAVCSQWCNRVIEMVDTTMSLDSTMGEGDRDKRRNDAMNQYAATVSLLKHTNWIGYLSITDESGAERRIVDSQTIDSSLEVFGQIDGFEEELSKHLQRFKEEVTFSMTGLPNFECPNCHSSQTTPESKYPSLIPINMVSYFFILSVWRNRTRSGAMGT